MITDEARLAAKESKRRDFSEKFAEKPTRKAAINLFCERCMGGPENAGYRTLIRQCSAGPESSLPCSLWPFRPYK